ncbi:MAG TPA: hypothetical protein VFF68_09200 [Anaerolineaceae bacterium]|nr:hypothetical protein [Anaerolineaceae bacterium]
MIQVRDTLQVKFGKIDQAVELFTGSHAFAPFSAREFQLAVLTDVSGEMYTLINEFVAPSLGAFETAREASFRQPGFDEWFRQFQLYVEGGSRTYYTVEGEYAPWTRPGLIVVRETYRSYKWQIETAVELLKRYGGLLVDRGVGEKPRILTDASGEMFRAVIEIETDSLSTWETRRRETYRQVEFQVWFNQMLAAVEAGAHDFYRVEYTTG